MAWCLVKHKDNFACMFTLLTYQIYGVFLPHQPAHTDGKMESELYMAISN